MEGWKEEKEQLACHRGDLAGAQATH